MNLDTAKVKHMIHKIYRKNIARYRLGNFTNFSPCYLATNENLSGYMSDLHFNKDNKILSVLASGDQLFTLISNGALNIDTFDTNSLAEYYVFGIKKALILKCGYEEYIKIFKILTARTTTETQFFDIMSTLLPYMDEKYLEFWQKILTYNSKIPKSEHHQNLLCTLAKEPVALKTEQIPYLSNENNFNTLKTNLPKAKITYTNLNAFKMHKKIKERHYYDCIILSNILDYAYWHFSDGWSYPTLKKYEQDVFPLLKENGTIFLNYVFDYEEDDPLISHSYIKQEHLSSEKVKTFESSGLRGAKDAVLLCRKKHNSID